MLEYSFLFYYVGFDGLTFILEHIDTQQLSSALAAWI
jgi:hypothetical protein